MDRRTERELLQRTPLSPVRPEYDRRPDGREGEAAVLDRFPAIVGASAEADSPAQNRWLYAWAEVAKTAAGYGGWAAKSGGRSGTTETDPARNRIEDMNDGAGVEGHGVDVDGEDYPSGFAVMPAPNGVLVEMLEIAFIVGGAVVTEYWFSHPSADDGTCT